MGNGNNIVLKKNTIFVDNQPLRIMLYEFQTSFGPRFSYCASYEIDLTVEDVAFIKKFLQENGDCDFSYIENENPSLFEKILDAANEAVLAFINEDRREQFQKGELLDDNYEPVTEYRDFEMDDLDWGNMHFLNYWPDELLP